MVAEEIELYIHLEGAGWELKPHAWRAYEVHAANVEKIYTSIEQKAPCASEAKFDERRRAYRKSC